MPARDDHACRGATLARILVDAIEHGVDPVKRTCSGRGKET
jgi:hypothetical protein